MSAPMPNPGEAAKGAPAAEAGPPAFPRENLLALLPLAFAEDEGPGDITSLATIPPESESIAYLIAKEEGVVAGLPAVAEIFAFRACTAEITCHVAEGARVEPGALLVTVVGRTRDILVCERILLNFLQRLSGIATAARRCVEALQPGRTVLLDTRKTAPGHRRLDKYAVRVGGGANHRMGLYDMVLVKDNHIRACGSAREAVERVRAEYGDRYQVEVEVEGMEDLESLLDARVDILLLDNMDDRELREAIRRVREAAPAIKLEASGNLDPKRLRKLREAGLDYVSLGSLTHSVQALDISLRFEENIV